jgi:hypothetical protein
MAFTAKDVMLRATTVLQDAGAVRWPATELLLWLNDAVRELALHKPNAVAETAELSLAQGTWQSLPAEYISLIRVSRNLTNVAADVGGRTGGKAITPIVREILDAQMPGWQDLTVLPASPNVTHIIQDMMDPRSFYVVPANDGTGIIEAIVSKMPADIVQPTNPLDIDSYTATVDLPDIYRNALVDFVLYRAFSKDMNLAGNAQRAGAHYQQFAQAIGMKTQTEQVTTVNTTGSQPNS